MHHDASMQVRLLPSSDPLMSKPRHKMTNLTRVVLHKVPCCIMIFEPRFDAL